MIGIEPMAWAVGGLVVGATAMRWFVRHRLARFCDTLENGADVSSSAGCEAVIADLVRARDRSVEAVRREQGLARRVAEEQASRLRRALGGLEDPVLVLDPGGGVTECNEAAIELGTVGRTSTPPTSTIEGLIPVSVAAREVRDLARGLAEAGGDEVRRTEVSAVDPGGEVRDFTVSLRRLDDSGRVLVVVHETTREREILRIKSEFVAKASHELRTPLSSIRATLEMLEEGDLEDAAARTEMVGIASEEADRLARMVDDMLDISRIEAGVARPRIGAVEMVGLAEEVVEGLRAAAAQRSIDLSVRRRDEELVAEGDREMLATVIGNLVGNAIKYVPAGERVVVEVAPDDLTRSIVVTVTDTGLGIPPEDLPRVFDKFYRIGRYERNARGSGLGLDLCRNIVEQIHRGRIGVDSTLGEGARFWFGVPARHASSMAA